MRQPSRAFIFVPRMAIAIAAAVMCASLWAQEAKDPPPGNMRLQPGYSHTSTGGAGDTRTGKIWKDGGPLMTYDIGPGFTSFATPRPGDKTLWTKQTTVGENTKIVINMQTDGTTLLVDIGRVSGFTALNVSSKDDMADIMLMLMSYRP